MLCNWASCRAIRWNRKAFSPSETELLRQVLRSPFETAMAIPLSADRRQAFSRKMLRYLSHHLGTTIDAKSLDVLHAVLA